MCICERDRDRERDRETQADRDRQGDLETQRQSRCRDVHGGIPTHPDTSLQHRDPTTSCSTVVCWEDAANHVTEIENYDVLK